MVKNLRYTAFLPETQPAKVRTMLPMRTFGLYAITSDS